MSAETILKMIEEVSPDDTAKMEEIDARVMAYLEGWEFKDYVRMYNDERMHGFTLDEGEILFTVQYTRSRDALKAIRPKGYAQSWPTFYSTGVLEYKYSFFGIGLGYVQAYVSPELPTEELAELHAIIQAIEYERNQDANNRPTT